MFFFVTLEEFVPTFFVFLLFLEVACCLFAMRSEGIGWIRVAFRGNLSVEIDEGEVQGDELCAVQRFT